MKKLVVLAVFGMWASLQAGGDMMFVKVPVASAWTDPEIEMRAGGYILPLVDKDLPQHDTQLLYGERVEVLERKDSGWCKVRCLEQPHYNRKTGEWGLCDAWMLEKDLGVGGYGLAPDFVVTSLWTNVYADSSYESPIVQRFSFGTLVSEIESKLEWVKIRLLGDREGYVSLQALDGLCWTKPSDDLEKVLRNRVVRYARKFLDFPYCWGGRSAYSQGISAIPTGVDCSGLVSLVYRACGFNVPRNSHPQFVKAEPVEPTKMKKGDLIFFKPEKYNFERVNHVMIYLGGENFIEATENSKSVRIVASQERFGVPKSQLENGGRVGAEGSQIEIHCGSFLSHVPLRDELRIK